MMFRFASASSLFLFVLLAQFISAEALPERVIRFAPGESIGKVVIREPGGEWRVFGEAFGAAKIPAEHEAGLVLKRYTRSAKQPLAPLANLAPNDIQMFTNERSTIADGEYAHLKPLTGLRIVRITNAAMTFRGAGHLAPLTDLVELDLSENKISQQIIAMLAPMRKLRRLSLAGNPVSNRAFLEFPLLEELESLDLSGCQVPDDAAPILARSVKLTELKLNRTKLSDKGLVVLSGLSALKKFELLGTNISDEGLKSLANLSELKELNLGSTKITAESIETLAGFNQLRAINLNDCGLVTDAAIPHLKEMKQLELLGIQQSGITQAGLAELEDALPECMIVSVTNPQPEKLAEVFSLK